MACRSQLIKIILFSTIALVGRGACATEASAVCTAIMQAHPDLIGTPELDGCQRIAQNGSHDGNAVDVCVSIVESTQGRHSDGEARACLSLIKDKVYQEEVKNCVYEIRTKEK